MVTSSGRRGRVVSLRFEFLPRKSYKDRFSVTPAGVLSYFEERFIHKVLLPVLNMTVRDRMKKIVVETGEEGAGGEGGGGARGRHASGESEGSGEGGGGGSGSGERRMDRIDRQGEGHASSDEEDLPEDADATEARKRSRQADDEGGRGGEELSDDDEEIVRNMAKMLEGAGDEDEDANLDDRGSSVFGSSRPVSPSE